MYYTDTEIHVLISAFVACWSKEFHFKEHLLISCNIGIRVEIQDPKKMVPQYYQRNLLTLRCKIVQSSREHWDIQYNYYMIDIFCKVGKLA